MATMSDEDPYLYICQKCKEQLVTTYCDACSKAFCQHCTKSHSRLSTACTEDKMLPILTAPTCKTTWILETERQALKLSNDPGKDKVLQLYNEDIQVNLAICKQEKQDMVNEIDKYFSKLGERLEQQHRERCSKLHTYYRERHVIFTRLLSHLHNAKRVDIMKCDSRWRLMDKSIRACMKPIKENKLPDLYGFEIENRQADIAEFLATEAISFRMEVGGPIMGYTEPRDDSSEGATGGDAQVHEAQKKQKKRRKKRNARRVDVDEGGPGAGKPGGQGGAGAGKPGDQGGAGAGKPGDQGGAGAGKPGGQGGAGAGNPGGQGGAGAGKLGGQSGAVVGKPGGQGGAGAGKPGGQGGAGAGNPGGQDCAVAGKPSGQDGAVAGKPGGQGGTGAGKPGGQGGAGAGKPGGQAQDHKAKKKKGKSKKNM